MEPPDWGDEMPATGRDQSCAFCGDPHVAWVHPLSPDRVTYEEYGKGHTLPRFWTLCDRCEGIYRSSDEDSAVEVMRTSIASTWAWVEDDDVEECVRKPLRVFRRADSGARPLDS